LERYLAPNWGDEGIDSIPWEERIELILAELDVIASGRVIEAAVNLDGLFSKARHPSTMEPGGPKLTAHSMLLETFHSVRDAVRKDMGLGLTDVGMAGRG
jgi:hypothetical protein